MIHERSCGDRRRACWMWLPSCLRCASAPSQAAAMAAMSRSCSRVCRAWRSKKCWRTNCPRLLAMRLCWRRKISVSRLMKGMGMRRNRAETANQSAKPPTSAASAQALSAPCHQLGGKNKEATKAQKAAASQIWARRLAAARLEFCIKKVSCSGRFDGLKCEKHLKNHKRPKE